MIAELQRELQELEADLGNEARAKARLHAMNSRLVQVIRELEATGDAIADAVEDSDRIALGLQPRGLDPQVSTANLVTPLARTACSCAVL